MARITVAEARKICTPAELGLLVACRPKAIEKLSADELKKNVDSARRLRDKWRDLATQQRRQTQRQQNSRVTDDNARSREKAALFAHALTKFDSQLKKIASDGAAAGTIASAKKVAKKPIKARPATAHREQRSAIRGSLKAVQSQLNAASAVAAPTAIKKTALKKTAVKKAAKKPAASAAAATKKKPAAKKLAPAKKKAVKKRAPTAAGAKKAAKKVAKSPRTAGLVSVDAQQQLAAATAAKKSRIKASGLLARVRGHVVARGRRAQGKRDARG